jgi:DNA-damage-inducible protein D
MGYTQWRRFNEAVDRARASALNTGDQAAVFTQVSQLADAGNLGRQGRGDWHLSRAAAYYVAMNGDPRKPEVAAAQAYFVRQTRQAETAALFDSELTARQRAAEMTEYGQFRNLMKNYASDYEPSSFESNRFFAATQNRLYLALFGMTAERLRESRDILVWPKMGKGRPPTKADLGIAKNYLNPVELKDLERAVGTLYLLAEGIISRGIVPSLAEWEAMMAPQLASIQISRAFLENRKAITP